MIKKSVKTNELPVGVVEISIEWQRHEKVCSKPGKLFNSGYHA